MNKVLLSIVLISLICGTYSFTCEGTGATSGTNNGWISQKGTATCAIPSETCVVGYSDEAGGASATPGADCDFCAINYVFGQKAHTTCVISSGTCVLGYAPSAGAATTDLAATVCDFCAAGYVFGQKAHTTCVISSGTCVLGYAPSAGAATTELAATVCDFCAAGYHFNSDSTACDEDGTACSVGFADSTELKSCVAAGGVCKIGHVSTGQVATAGVVATGAACTTCATGYFPVTSVALAACGQACATGYNFASVAKDTCVLAGQPCIGDSASSATVTTAGVVGTGVDCTLCKALYIFGNLLNTTCVLGTGACSTGYTSTADASANIANNGCKYCAANYAYNSPLNSSCVITGGACATGFASNSAGSTLTVGASLPCVYCATGKYWTSTAKTACGVACAAGFQTSTGTTTAVTADCLTVTPAAAGTTTSGKLIMFSTVILALLALFI